MSNLLHTTYPLDTKLCLALAEKARPLAFPYKLSAQHDWDVPEWLMAEFTSDYIEQIKSDIGLACESRFYFQEKNFYLPEHQDTGTTCSLNFVLSDDPAPVTINGIDYTYTQALMDTSQMHGVKNSASERILLKLSIIDMDFKQASKHLKLKGYAL